MNKLKNIKWVQVINYKYLFIHIIYVTTKSFIEKNPSLLIIHVLQLVHGTIGLQLIYQSSSTFRDKFSFCICHMFYYQTVASAYTLINNLYEINDHSTTFLRVLEQFHLRLCPRKINFGLCLDFFLFCNLHLGFQGNMIFCRIDNLRSETFLYSQLKKIEFFLN